MPRTYVPKPKSYNDLDLERALTQIRDGKLTLREASKKFRVDKSKLSRVLNKKNILKRGRKQALSQEQEADLTEKITIMAKWGFALSKEEIKSIVQTYVKENNLQTVFKDGKPGNDWFQMFCRRNKLSQKKMEQLEKCRRTATSDPFIIYSFYDRLEETINELGLNDKPANIFNLDETSFNLDPGRVKGVAAKGQKVHRHIEGSGKENVTTMACISASGVLLPPLIIFQGQNLWSTWKGTSDLKDTCYAVSEKGWMTTAVFNSWFVKFCEMVPQRPLLVILDGHVSHLDRGTIEIAIRNNITLFKLPPHVTDVLQPLDKCCFGPLKLKWNQKLIEWQRMNQRKLTKSEFADMICALWNEGIDEATIKKSFESTGIFPCCREKYPRERLNEIKLQRYDRGARDAYPLNVYDLDEQEKIENNSQQTHHENKDENQNGDFTIQEAAVETIEEIPSTSTSSFETILLKKINKTNPETKRRRKIDSNCAVLTSAEYLSRIKEKEISKKKKIVRRKAQKTDYSSSDEENVNIEMICQDESDDEGMTLADIVQHDELNRSDQEISRKIIVGDYILVKFPTKKKVVHYIALVENVENCEFSVSYLRRNGDKFIFPQIPERFNVSQEDVVMKLPPPISHRGTARVSDQLTFEISFAEININ